jgi:Protein of unknown function (DUF2840)
MMAPDHRYVFLSRPSAEAPKRDLRDGVIDVAPKLTHVEILWIRQRVENRIRFGRIDQQHVIDRHWRVVSFPAGSIFAFVRWAANAYGTVLSRIDILRAVKAVETLGIDPADVASEYWRHVHNRLSVGDRPQSYTQTRHHAWLRRKRVMS